MSPSLAVNLRTYVPAIVNVAVVSTADESLKVTVPGPEVLVHVVVNVPLAGKPSSETVPSSEAVEGRVIV